MCRECDQQQQRSFLKSLLQRAMLMGGVLMAAPARAQRKTCRTCKGSGQVLGQCAVCNGAGKAPNGNTCQSCGGSGQRVQVLSDLWRHGQCLSLVPGPRGASRSGKCCDHYPSFCF